MVRHLRGEPEEKTWTYMPQSRDLPTLTLPTPRAGVVARMERTISR